MPVPLPTRFAMLSDVGRIRAHNEDACAADPESGIFVVCDGMGGAAGGEVASAEAAQAFVAYARQTRLTGHNGPLLEDAMGRANRAVFERALREPRLRGMGTTLVALEVMQEASTVAVAHAGDSRCYRLRAGVLTRLTQDHSLVEEQFRAGEITADEARRSHLRNIITRVIGSQSHVEPEIARHAAMPDDIYLLCSDGLTRDLADEDLRVVLQRHRDKLDEAARMLVEAANRLGGGDNITVVLVAISASAGNAVAEAGDAEAGDAEVVFGEASMPVAPDGLYRPKRASGKAYVPPPSPERTIDDTAQPAPGENDARRYRGPLL